MSPTHDTGEEVWREPVRGGYPDPAAFSLSGIDRLGALVRGEAPRPPLTRLTGARLRTAGDGTATAEMPLSDWLASAAGVITGGTLAIVADIGLGVAIETRLPAATPYTTAELSLSYLCPAWPSDRTLSAHGQSIHVGRTVGLSEVFLIEEGSERLVGHGTSRCAILPPLEDPPEPPPSTRRPDEATAAPNAEEPAATDPAAEGSAAAHGAAGGAGGASQAGGRSDPYMRPAAGIVLDETTWHELGGAEVLRRLIAGELPMPPIHALTGLRPIEAGEASATTVLPATEWLASPYRRVQGGAIAMLADAAMLFAVQTTVEPGTAFAGLDLKVNFLRPVYPDGRELVARAEVVNRGRTLAIARSEITNAEGKRVALATGSSIYLPGRPASLGDVELSEA